MFILYNFSILLLRILFQGASFFNAKARAFVKGRKNIFSKLHDAFENNSSPVIWMHCASLGEFEQGRPVIESIKRTWTQHKVLLTFFSPSGYIIQKDYAHADYIFYLPWDSQKNAKKFISITKPVLSIFVKYEFWYNYSIELKRQSIPLLSISTIFRKEQTFFKPYGGFYRKILKNFSYFFVQNELSEKLLHSINIQNCKQAGDTRFDRVNLLAQQRMDLPIVEKFKNAKSIFIAGSCWTEDLEVLAPFINKNHNELKFIIAPHEISNSFLLAIEKSLVVKSIRLSQATEGIENYDVLIIDNIGMLSKLYRYGEFAFVGGAFGKGLHNILEPACYGIPIFFGDRNYKKFQEANELLQRGGAFAISDYRDFNTKYNALAAHTEKYEHACSASVNYVKENLGATNVIMDYCNKLLQS